MRHVLYFLFSTVFLSLTGCSKTANETLEQPLITSFRSQIDTVGSVVTIYGKNFSERSLHNKVIFNTKEAIPFLSTNDSLKVIVPVGASTGAIQVKVYSNTASSRDTFYVATGRWKKMADFAGGGRMNATGFSINNKGYVGTGTGNSGSFKDFWEYNPSTNNWAVKQDFPGGPHYESISFVIGTKCYVGYGRNPQIYSPPNDFYEFDPTSGIWTRKADIPFNYNEKSAVGLGINGKGYIITGGFSKQVLEYNPQSDSWSKKRNFPGDGRTQASGFVINNKGYIAGGTNGTGPFLRDLWEYEPITDQWSRKADMRFAAVDGIGFSLNGKGYVGLGYVSSDLLWEYDPSNNSWKLKSVFPGIANISSVAFVIDNAAYIATGYLVNNVSSELWKYEPQ